MNMNNSPIFVEGTGISNIGKEYKEGENNIEMED